VLDAISEQEAAFWGAWLARILINGAKRRFAGDDHKIFICGQIEM
jgi:hypothetical protein